MDQLLERASLPTCLLIWPLCFAESCHLCWSCFCYLCDKLSDSKKSVLFLSQPDLPAFLTPSRTRRLLLNPVPSYGLNSLKPVTSRWTQVTTFCHPGCFTSLPLSWKHPPEIWYLVHLSDCAQFSGPRHSLWTILRLLDSKLSFLTAWGSQMAFGFTTMWFYTKRSLWTKGSRLI